MAGRPMVRTVSAEGSLTLSHPTPDLQSPTDGFATHVERLEHRAERMSSSGSDIGDEIRKLKLSGESSRSSLRSGAALPDDNKPLPVGRSRNTSISSYANSIVDVNTAARWGGYSPGAYVTSPKGSLRSGYSHRPVQHPHSVPEEADTATVSNEPRAGTTDLHIRNTSQFSLEYDQIVQDIHNELSNVPSQLSAPAAGAYNHVSYGMIDPYDLPDRPATADTYQQAERAFMDFDGVHCTSSSMMGLREISEGSEHSLLHSLQPPQQERLPPPDDGMVYYPAPVPKMLNLPKRLSQLPSTDVRAKRRTQVLDNLAAEARNSALWLGGGEATKVDKRKSANPRQSMMSMPPQLRASMFFDQPSVPHDVDIKGESAEQTLEGILEASTNAPVSAFTDHPVAGPVGKFIYGKENKRKSTSTLLDKRKSSASLLDMDKRKSSATLLEPEKSPEKEKKQKRKSSFGFLLGRRSSSTDQLKKLAKKNSSGDKINKLQKRNGSQLSLGNAIGNAPEHQRQGSTSSHNSHVDESTPLHEQPNPMDTYHGLAIDRDESEEDDDDDATAQPESQYFGPPTTLLAELQMRKAQQRTRNRTAATAFPDGMHSTLLQLDAVAEIEKKRRQAQRINLAWEAQAADDDDDEDEDVPLGMLFPGQNGLAQKAGQGVGGRGNDWDRPLGLLEKKELEDNEPLSRRRNRLRGLAPVTTHSRDVSPGKRMTVTSLDTPRISVTPSPEPPAAQQESEDEDEPLAARRERLKRKEALDEALGDMKSRPISGDFASEMLSQFGALGGDAATDGDKAADKAASTPMTPNAVDEEEETLGQRRARLQAEALARSGGDSGTPSGLPTNNPLRPPLKASRSLADILSAHPAGNTARRVSNDALLSNLPAGSLLLRNEQKVAKHQALLRDGNRRSTSYYGLDRPLVDVSARDDGRTKSMLIEGSSGGRGLLGTQQPGSGFGAVGLNSHQRMSTMSATSPTGMSGVPATPMSLPAMGSTQFPQQAGMMGTMGGMGGMGMGMGMMPQQPVQPMMMMPMPMQMNMNMGMGMGMGGFMPGNQTMMSQPYGMGVQMPPMQMGIQPGIGMQMPAEGSLDPGRRDAIDRWRQGIL